MSTENVQRDDTCEHIACGRPGWVVLHFGPRLTPPLRTACRTHMSVSDLSEFEDNREGVDVVLNLTFAAPCPPLNSNDRLNRYLQAARVKQWRARAHAAAIQRGKPTLLRAHVVATFSFADNRRRDVGNFYPTIKACIDGIVDAGVLADDSDKYVVGPDLRRGPKAGALTLTITLDASCVCVDCIERFTT